MKTYIPGNFGPVECSADLYIAMARANAWFTVDRIGYVIHVISRNSDAPLTNEEKEQLRAAMTKSGCEYSIVFDN